MEEEAVFDRPVEILTGKALSVAKQVKTAAQAAHYLLDEWPSSPGAKHLAARHACLAALEGVKKRRAELLARKAREAFEEAAEEANIRVMGSGLPQGPGRRDKRKADAG